MLWLGETKPDAYLPSIKNMDFIAKILAEKWFSFHIHRVPKSHQCIITAEVDNRKGRSEVHQSSPENSKPVFVPKLEATTESTNHYKEQKVLFQYCAEWNALNDSPAPSMGRNQAVCAGWGVLYCPQKPQEGQRETWQPCATQQCPCQYSPLGKALANTQLWEMGMLSLRNEQVKRIHASGGVMNSRTSLLWIELDRREGS